MTSFPVAVIGYGMSARRFHAPLIAATKGLHLAAVVARKPDVVAQVRDAHPGAAVVSSVDELLGLNERPVVAVVATPDETHFAIANMLIAAGMAVVVEKPLASTAAAARELVSAARAQGVLLATFQNRRWDGDFLTVRTVIASGVLGSITRFESAMTRWVVGAPPDNWRLRPGGGVLSGALGGFGSHLADQAISAFGPVESVYGEVAARRGAVSDDVFIALRHGSGVTSHLLMGVVFSNARPRFVVQGLNGSFTTWGFDGQQQHLLAGIHPLSPAFGEEPQENWGELAIGAHRDGHPLAKGDWRQFYVQLRTKLLGLPSTIVTGAEVLHSLDVLEAAELSSRSGQSVSIISERSSV